MTVAEIMAAVPQFSLSDPLDVNGVGERCRQAHRGPALPLELVFRA